jgi:hypothetical protein
VIHTKSIALNHNDSIDRKVATRFLEERGWYDIEEGGEFELDLIVPKFKRGADMESFKGNLNTFKQDGYFRIPARKQKYWSGNPTYINNEGNQRINKYKDWFVDYIQFLNKSNTELLWYSYKTIVPYHTNIIEWKGLYKKGFKGNQAKFIKIPYKKGIKEIQYWKLIDGVWTKINLVNS